MRGHLKWLLALSGLCLAIFNLLRKLAITIVYYPGRHDLFLLFLLAPTQLAVTAVVSVRSRPVSSLSWLTEFYFVIAMLNNMIYVGGVMTGPTPLAGLAMNSEGVMEEPELTALMGFAALPGSVGTISIMHWIVMRRLQEMGTGYSLRALIYAELGGMASVSVVSFLSMSSQKSCGAVVRP